MRKQMRIAVIAVLFGLLALSSAWAQASGNAELAPGGTLRVAVVGNDPVLVSKRPDGTFVGIAMDLANFLAGKLDAKLKPVVYPDLETYAKSLGKGEWDLVIGPRRPLEGDKLDLGPFVLNVDALYVAAPGRSFAKASEVDRSGVKVAAAVQDGSPEKFLAATLKSATLVPLPPGASYAVDALQSGKADVYGANGEIAHAVAARLPGAKVVEGPFATAGIALQLPKGKSLAARNRLLEVVKEAKARNLPQEWIKRHGLKAVRPVP